jgi:anti-anti-sigma regulatory factor
LPISVEWQETQSLVRLEGQLGFGSAVELKCLLRQCLASGKEVTLDVEHVQEMDASILQLLWATSKEATRVGIPIVSRVSEEALTAARQAGFRTFPTLSPE